MCELPNRLTKMTFVWNVVMFPPLHLPPGAMLCRNTKVDFGSTTTFSSNSATDGGERGIALLANWVIISTINPPPRNQRLDLFNERFMAARHNEGYYWKRNIRTFYFVQRPIDQWGQGGCRGTPYSRSYGGYRRSWFYNQPAISLKRDWRD